MMAKIHTITKEEIEIDRVVETTLCSSYGMGESKKLVIEVNILKLDSKYKVINHDKTEYYGSDLDKAIETYNEALQK